MQYWFSLDLCGLSLNKEQCIVLCLLGESGLNTFTSGHPRGFLKQQVSIVILGYLEHDRIALVDVNSSRVLWWTLQFINLLNCLSQPWSQTDYSDDKSMLEIKPIGVGMENGRIDNTFPDSLSLCDEVFYYMKPMKCMKEPSV